MNAIAKFLGTCIILCAVVLGTVWVLNQATADESADDPQAPAVSLDSATLDASLQRLIADNSDLDMSVSVIDLQTGKAYHYGDTSSFTAASIGKLFTSTLFLHKVELGQASLDDQVGADTAATALDKLIVESDNTAWHNFNQLLTLESLQQYARSLGIESYDSTSNTVDTDDIALLLERLSQGKLLNNEHTELLLSLMRRSEMDNFLVAGAPAGATAYHKIGYLSDRLHDAAIISKNNRSFAVVAFSKSAGNYDFERGASLFQAVTGDVSDVFFAGSSSNATGE